MSTPDISLVITLVVIAVTLVCTCVVVIASIAIPFWLMRSNKKKVENLMATGQQGEATVLSLEDTGMRINDDPRVTVLLEIRLPNYPPYQVRKTMTIPIIRLSQVQVGSVVGVLADPAQPANPDKVGLLLK